MVSYPNSDQLWSLIWSLVTNLNRLAGEFTQLQLVTGYYLHQFLYPWIMFGITHRLLCLRTQDTLSNTEHAGLPKRLDDMILKYHNINSGLAEQRNLRPGDACYHKDTRFSLLGETFFLSILVTLEV